MIKVTIECPDKEIKTIEGEGIIFVIPNNDNMKTGIIGNFNFKTLIGSVIALKNTSIDALNKFEERIIKESGVI